MLVNMIASDGQFLGEDITPWSFELFELGLDIILVKMGAENFKVHISWVTN